MLKKSGIMIIYCPTVCPGFWLRREAHEKGSQWFVCATSELCWPHLYNANGHQCHIKALAWIQTRSFYGAMDVSSQELQDLLLVGVFGPVTKQHNKACATGTKGDWPYLSKVAKFTRTFRSPSNLVRIREGRYVLPAKTSFPMKKPLPNRQDGWEQLELQCRGTNHLPLLKGFVTTKLTQLLFFMEILGMVST